jgi:exodeoxyribonuclease V alpha subunit
MSISVTVTISTVYPGSSGGAIFLGHDAAGKSMRFVAGRDRIFRAPIVGEVWALKGVSRRHAKYGEQVHIETAILAAPSGRLVVDFLMRHPAFKGLGIGKARARRLWEALGQDLGVVLGQGVVEKLTGVLSAECAGKLVEAWQAVSEEAGIIAFLDHHGFDLHLANKIRTVWPRDTLAKLRENPYRMLAFASWEKVDRMARSLGVADDDPRRRIAAVEACLYRRLDAKHTLTGVSTLAGDVAAALHCGESTAVRAIGAALRERAIVAVADGYQPVGAAVMEKVVAGYLCQLLAGELGPERNLFSGNLSAIVTESIERHRSNTGLKLNPAQRRAVEMAVHYPLSVLTGGAGTGKTTVLRLVHEVAERIGVPVLQMALSGRAAQRLREATGRGASTIAAFLRADARGLVDSRSEPLIIIDESSMLDLPITYDLVRRLPARARLLLVGDPYQLPPIGFGLIFQILAVSPSVPRVELVEIHRQAMSSGIPQIADTVRHGVAPRLPDFAGRAYGVNFIDAGDDAVTDNVLRVLTAWKECDDVQTLGVVKRGANGIRAINATMHAYAAATRKKLEGWDLAEGEPIIYLTNDYQKGLWNGSLGRIDRVMVSAGRRALSCSLDGTEHVLVEEDFQHVDLAYAITVHKAQGSQFKRVIVPVTRSRLLDRALIYTALTRGIEQVVFIGDRHAFDRAIVAEPHSQERQVGFSV